jgi:Tol biopolymer transport system component
VEVKRTIVIALLCGLLVSGGATAALGFGSFGEWTEAQEFASFGPGAHADFNTGAVEGCPFISPDGKMFFIASNRAGGLGGLDIWVSTRPSTGDAWGEPVNVGAPINSAANDFCPTIDRDGRTFFFVSTRSGHCGPTPNADIYTARFDQTLQASLVTHLGCEVNSAWDEHSPYPHNLRAAGPSLFYSSARPADGSDAPGDHDLYVSVARGGAFGTGEAIAELNTTANEGQPNVRRDGMEIFFWSDRAGGIGGADIYASVRSQPVGDWEQPQNLGPEVNSLAGETRPSLAWDGTTLYFGSTRTGGQSDIYATTR